MKALLGFTAAGGVLLALLLLRHLPGTTQLSLEAASIDTAVGFRAAAGARSEGGTLARIPGSFLSVERQSLPVYERVELDAIAFEMQEGRKSIFFDATAFLHGVLDRDPLICEHIADYMCDWRIPGFAELTVKSWEDRPQQILDRMALLDILEGIALDTNGEHPASDAVLGLAKIFAEPLPAEMPIEVKRLIAADKADALTALIHVDQGFAMALYRDVKGKPLAEVLHTTVVGALYDNGLRGEMIDRAMEGKDTPVE